MSAWATAGIVLAAGLGGIAAALMMARVQRNIAVVGLLFSSLAAALLVAASPDRALTLALSAASWIIHVIATLLALRLHGRNPARSRTPRAGRQRPTWTAWRRNTTLAFVLLAACNAFAIYRTETVNRAQRDRAQDFTRRLASDARANDLSFCTRGNDLRSTLRLLVKLSQRNLQAAVNQNDVRAFFAAARTGLASRDCSRLAGRRPHNP